MLGECFAASEGDVWSVAARCADEQQAPLPADQVVFSTLFSLCGVDYAGPLLLSEGQGTRKVWIALFVCGVIRAVHLEFVLSLSVEDFLWHGYTLCPGDKRHGEAAPIMGPLLSLLPRFYRLIGYFIRLAPLGSAA